MTPLLAARQEMLREALAEMEDAVTVWVDGTAEAGGAAGLADILGLQPKLRMRRMALPPDGVLPRDRYPLYRLGPEDAPRQARAGFIGFPEGFMLDALCDLAVAISRGDQPASPLARDTLRSLAGDVEVRILTSPG